MFSETSVTFWSVIGGVAGLGAFLLALPKIQNRLSKPKLNNAVKVDFNFRGNYSEGILINFDPDQNLAYFQDHGLIAYNHPSLSISIRSESSSSWIRVAPYALIKIESIQLASDPHLYVNMEEGKGGGGMPRYLQAVFQSTSSELFKASYLGEDFSSYSYFEEDQALPDTKRIYESFKLEPGEIELFDIDFHIEPGFIYDFSVGVEYVFEEKSNTIWSPRYLIGVPKQAELWTVKGIKRLSREYEWGEYPKNYREVGLKILDDQTYSPPSFNQTKAKALFNFCQKIIFRNSS